MGEHLVNGEFKSDKYAWCPPGFVPLKLADPAAQDLLWRYARRRRKLDGNFADDLEEGLLRVGFEPSGFAWWFSWVAVAAAGVLISLGGRPSWHTWLGVLVGYIGIEVRIITNKQKVA